MFMIGPRCRGALLTGALSLTLSLVPYAAAMAQQEDIDPGAVQLLRAATTYLAGQQKLSVKASSSIEVVLFNGQRIEFNQAAVMHLQRPNRMKSVRDGDLIEQEFYYDGKTLTLFNPAEKYFATVAVPGTIDAMFDYARDSLDIVAPAGDLIYSNAFDILMTDVTSAFIVGSSVIDGVPCTHLAFRAPGIDWQLWIQDGETPLPRKFVLTSTDVPGSPEFSVRMTSWDTNPNFAPGFFDFKRPADAMPITFQSPNPSGSRPE